MGARAGRDRVDRGLGIAGLERQNFKAAPAEHPFGRREAGLAPAGPGQGGGYNGAFAMYATAPDIYRFSSVAKYVFTPAPIPQESLGSAGNPLCPITGTSPSPEPLTLFALDAGGHVVTSTGGTQNAKAPSVL